MKCDIFMLNLLNCLLRGFLQKVLFFALSSFLRRSHAAASRLALLVGLGFLVVSAARAQAPTPADTLHLTLPEAEQRFVQNNLELLAQRYNITVQQALAVQARLIDNPTLLLDQNIILQAVHRKEVDGSQQPNQVAFQVQQLFALAGRRRAAGRVQEQGAIVETYNLEDLVRNLRYQLRTTFYDIYYRQQTLRVYDTEIPQLRRTVDLYQGQYEKGNIALKEVIRLKAFLFTLETERVGLVTDQANAQADLHILLRDSVSTVYQPVADGRRIRNLSPAAYAEPQLTDSALVRRADLLASRANVQRQNLNLRLQRAVATPDLAVGYNYDRFGSYFDNYQSVTLGLNVPIFNRNQGNIQAAKAQIAQAQAQAQQRQLVVRREVHEAYQVLLRQDELYQHTNRDTTPFSTLIDNIEKSYTKRLISIVEYLDFYEAYKNNVLQLNALRTNRMRAFENVNLAVGRTLYRAE